MIIVSFHLLEANSKSHPCSMTDTEVHGHDSQTDIFFRVVDRLQLESFIGSLTQDQKSLVIVSPHPELTQYYGDVLIRRLQKKFANVPIEVFVADNTDSILERFNVILTALSFDEATKARDLNQPEIIFVIQDAKKLGVQNLELLLRLIQIFPGSGICTLLMFDSAHAQTINIFKNNSRFMTWALQLPTPEQKHNTLEAAKKTGQQDLVSAFFAQFSESEKSTAQPISQKPVPSAPENKPEAPETGQPIHHQPPAPSAPEQKPEAPSSVKKKKKKPVAHWPKLLIGGGLLSITMGVTAVLHPEISTKLLAALKPNSNPPAAESTPLPQVSPPETLEPEVVLTELPEKAIQGLNWALNLNSEHYVLEYKTFEKMADAQDYLKSKAGLDRARIVPVLEENQIEAKFMVVDGPHKSAEAARFAASRSTLVADIAIEKVSSLVEYSNLKKLKP